MKATVLTRPELKFVIERSLSDWVKAIKRDTPDIIDIAGGEPLLVGWIPELIETFPGIQFFLSTNARVRTEIERLASHKIPNLYGINVSIHPHANNSHEQLVSVLKLRAAGYDPHCNIVCFEDTAVLAHDAAEKLRESGVHVVLSPYEYSGNLDKLTERGLLCEAGRDHMVIAPDGNAWPCLTTLRSPYWEETCLGNWLDGDVDLSKIPQPCYLACHDYYILSQMHEAGDMWGVKARLAE